MKTSTKLANYLIALVLILVPFHAFLTVWVSSLAGHFFGLRLWDEVILITLLFIVAGWLLTDKKLAV